MLSYSELQSAHSNSASASLSTWSKMPSDDSKISRLLFWWLTLHAEFIRHIFNSTVIKGELCPLISTYRSDDPTHPTHIAYLASINAIILPLPAEPEEPNNLTTSLQVSIYQLALSRYDRKLKLFHAQQLAMNSLKENMLASLDETTKSLCFSDKTQLNSITFYDIFRRVADIFNTPLPAHVDAINILLAEPFTYVNSNSYDAHVAKHRDAHSALDAMLCKKRPIDMCNDFRHSLLISDHAAEFRPFLTIYDAEYVSLHQQSLEAIQKACIPAISHIIAKVAQASATRFAVNAATDPPAPPKKPNNGTKRWCWTHGLMFHSSDRCKKPAPGHQKTATLTNKMGSTK